MSGNTVIGNRIGRIQILGLLGEGGMGQVYEGFDERLERRVAVKRLDDSSRMNDVTKARFDQEAKLLSRLDHPNICRIFDFLEENGDGYLVLELIDGTNLRELMAREIDRPQRLRIVEQIAEALAAAHSEGVVHRDLKPDNVMVSDDGVVKVLDFGIAHSVRGDVFHDKTLPGTAPFGDRGIKTVDGRAVGTPRFMSPEQARGEIVTPASDLFSLGLLMQELLTGEEPYDPDLSPDDLLQEVSEGRSRPVVGLSRPLTEVIERLKSLSPVERMTAAEVVRKLRWIAGTKQRRLTKGIAALVAVAVVIGVIKYTVDLRRERSLAVEARTDSEELVAFLLDDLARSLSPLGRLSVLEKVSARALDYFDDLPKPLSAKAALNRGQAFGMVADIHLDQGQLSQAMEAAVQALEIHEGLIALDPENPAWRNAVAEDFLRIGGLQDMRGESTKALQALTASQDIASDLVAVDTENVRFRETLGEVSYALGLNVLFIDPEKAIEHFNHGITTYRRLSEGDPKNLSYRYRLAVLSGQGLGQAYSISGRDDLAFEAVTRANEEYEVVVGEDSSNAHWLFAFAWEKRRLSELLIGMGRLNDAWDLYAESFVISSNLVAREPRNSAWREGLAVDFFGMADIRRHQDRLEEALELYEKAAEIYGDLVEIEPGSSFLEVNLAGALDGQGITLTRLGEVRSAEMVWRRAMRAIEDCPGSDGDADLSCLAQRATLLIRLGRVTDAEPLVEQLAALGYVENFHGEDLRGLLEAER